MELELPTTLVLSAASGEIDMKLAVLGVACQSMQSCNFYHNLEYIWR